MLMNLLFSFTGRIGHRQFWLDNLSIVVLVGLFLIVLMLIFPSEQLNNAYRNPERTNPATLPMWIGYLLLAIITTWITIAISIKRFHDRGKSGWWCLIVLIPLIGPIWWLIELGFLRGDPGPNTYGLPVVPA